MLLKIVIDSTYKKFILSNQLKSEILFHKKSSLQHFITRTLALNMTTISKYDVSKIFELLACVYVNLPLFKYYCRRGNHIFPSKHLTRPKYYEFTTDSLYKLPYQSYTRLGGTCGDSGDPILLIIFKCQHYF